MSEEENVLVEVRYIKKKVDEIDDILRGVEGKSGLIAKVNYHDAYIEEQRISNKQKSFDTYRVVMAGLVTLLVGLVMWNTRMIKDSFKEEIRRQITTN